MKVLLIDDEPDPHKMMRAIVNAPPPIMPKVELFEAMNFDGGMLIVHEHAPDVVLLDLNLHNSPRPMNAVETIARMEAELAFIVPVLVITGHVEATNEWTAGELWRMAREAGACGYLRKDRYLDPRYRESLLHELADARLEFSTRRMVFDKMAAHHGA